MKKEIAKMISTNKSIPISSSLATYRQQNSGFHLHYFSILYLWFPNNTTACYHIIMYFVVRFEADYSTLYFLFYMFMWCLSVGED